MPGTGELGPLPEHSPCSPGKGKEGMSRQGENRGQDLGAVQGKVQTRSEGHRRISQVGFREGGRRGGRKKERAFQAVKGRASAKALRARRTNSRLRRITESQAGQVEVG